MANVESMTTREALAGAAEVLRALGKNLESIARRAERGAEGCLLPTRELFDLLKFFNATRGVAAVLTAADLNDDDGAEQINRNFRAMEEVLRNAGMIDGPDDGFEG